MKLIVFILAMVLLAGCSETEKLEKYKECYGVELKDLGASNICHQFCSGSGLHGYDTKAGQLLVCVCDDPKDREAAE